jgi:hypothetical protein
MRIVFIKFEKIVSGHREAQYGGKAIEDSRLGKVIFIKTVRWCEDSFNFLSF